MYNLHALRLPGLGQGLCSLPRLKEVEGLSGCEGTFLRQRESGSGRRGEKKLGKSGEARRGVVWWRKRRQGNGATSQKRMRIGWKNRGARREDGYYAPALV